MHRAIMYPFEEFQPVGWVAPGNREAMQPTVYSIRRNHGILSNVHFYNTNDSINRNRNLLDKVVLQYRIGRNHYDLFTVRDFFEAGYSFEGEKGDGNILGEIAERISRRICKFFLKHFSPFGYTGGIFDKRFDPKNRNNFIVANTNEYILKIRKYPNLVILRRSGKGKYGYENIKELDGLFDYRFQNTRHILVLESKLERINVNCDDLVNNLFIPLRQFFPEAFFSYILFSDRDSIFAKRKFHKQHKLKQVSQKIYQTLCENGIGVLFFYFNEGRQDFERMKDHLVTQYRSTAHLGLTFHGKMQISDREIILFDEGRTPHIKLIKDKHTGMWREVAFRHKKISL
ncbi:MAG: hypothetical protein GF398_21930 [Chitinivibrionales bacterium]|nr:hypothetical protein [Chitinivibrionales bacterium]